MSVTNTQMVGGAGKAHPRKEKANVEMLAISKSGQKVDWCLLPIFATLYRVKNFFKTCWRKRLFLVMIAQQKPTSCQMKQRVITKTLKIL